MTARYKHDAVEVLINGVAFDGIKSIEFTPADRPERHESIPSEFSATFDVDMSQSDSDRWFYAIEVATLGRYWHRRNQRQRARDRRRGVQRTKHYLTAQQGDDWAK